MGTIRLPKIKKLIIFSGGALLLDFIREAEKRNIEAVLFAVRRHLEERIYPGDNRTLEQVLEEKKVRYYQESDINRSKELFKLIDENTLGVGLGEAYTFAQKTIDAFGGKLFDFMVINLPEYRGGAHFTWQILRKSTKGCWNIQVINKDMVPGVFDSGAVIKRREYVISVNCRVPSDIYALSDKEGLQLFKDFLDDIEAGMAFVPKPLDEGKSSYFPRMYTLKHGYINWSWSAEEIDRFICAFDDPYPGASTYLGGKKVFIKKCRMDRSEGGFHPFISGLIFRIQDGKVFAAANGGALEIGRICDETGKDCVKNLKPGQRLYTPVKYIEEAMLFDAEYDSEGLKTGK
ncbi:MAG: hypothetical protein JW803_08145 [Endomicrobiales bacterium]|nr:hypothetical protein [Endomicrobiales bacterium]